MSTEELQAGGTSDLAREADAVPLPAQDNLSPDQPGEPTDPAAPGAAPIAGELTDEQAGEIAAKYRAVVGLAISGIADSLLPNWNITAPERDQLTASMSLALAHWFPDGYIPPKWVALAGVLFTGYSIVNARRNEDGTWKPRKIVLVQRSSSGQPLEAAAAEASKIATADVSAPGGAGFSTSA